VQLAAGSRKGDNSPLNSRADNPSQGLGVVGSRIRRTEYVVSRRQSQGVEEMGPSSPPSASPSVLEGLLVDLLVGSSLVSRLLAPVEGMPDRRVRAARCSRA